MKKIFLALVGVLLLSGCTNKNMITYYENTKAGKGIDSYQIDLRVYGSYGEKSYGEIVRMDNYKGEQVKIDYISNEDTTERLVPKERIVPKEAIEGPTTEKEAIEGPTTEKEPSREIDMLLRDEASYVIGEKKYSLKDGVYAETENLLYSNPNAYLETITKAKDVKELDEDKVGEEVYKTYSFKVKKEDMKDILNDGVLKDLDIKEDATGKVWIDKDSRISRVVYTIGTDTKKLEINAAIFRINTINDMSNIIK